MNGSEIISALDLLAAVGRLVSEPLLRSPGGKRSERD